MPYAAETTVSPERSREEIEALLDRRGATGFSYGQTPAAIAVAFLLDGRYIRYAGPLPRRDATELTRTAGGTRRRSEAKVEDAYRQLVRQRWRALLLVLRARFEEVDAGITSVEDAFMAQTVLPNNQTAGEWLRPQLADSYATGAMPTDLLALPPPPRTP